MLRLPFISYDYRNGFTLFNPDGSLRKPGEKLSNKIGDQIKILQFETGIEPTINEETGEVEQFSSFIAGANYTNPVPQGEYFSRNVAESPMDFHEGWTVQDPLLGRTGQEIAGNNTYIHYNRSGNRIYALMKTPFYDLEEAKQNKSIYIRNAVRAIFNVYDKACSFYDLDLYREDSPIVTLLKDMSNREGEQLVLEGSGTFVQNLTQRGVEAIGGEGTLEAMDEAFDSNQAEAYRQNFVENQQPVSYDFSTLGLTDEEERSPSKIIDAAIAAGVLNLYTISDYLDTSGYKQLLVNEEFIVPTRNVVHIFLEFNASFFEAVPTNKAIADSWLKKDDEERRDISLASDPEAFDSATDQYIAENIDADLGPLVTCMYKMNIDDLPPGQKMACEQELEEFRDRVDRIGFAAISDGDIDELSRRYPNAVRSAFHLKERYGTFAAALTDMDTAKELTKRIGKKMLKAEAAAYHKQLVNAAMRRNIMEDYNSASSAIQKRAGLLSNQNSGTLVLPMDKFDAMLGTVCDAFSQFDSQLNNFYAEGGFLRTEQIKTIPSEGQSLITTSGAGGRQTLVDKVNNNLVVHPDKILPPVPAFSMTESTQKKAIYRKTLRFNAETANLKLLGTELKTFVMSNLAFLKQKAKEKNLTLPAEIQQILDRSMTLFLPSIGSSLPVFSAVTDPSVDLHLDFAISYGPYTTYTMHLCPMFGLRSIAQRKLKYMNPVELSAAVMDEVLQLSQGVGSDADGLKDVVSSSRQRSSIFIKVEVGEETKFINLGHPQFCAPGQSLGNFLKKVHNQKHTAGYFRHLKDIYTQINEFSLCSAPVPGGGGSGINSLFGPARTPSGFALQVAANYTYPICDPSGFASAAAGAKKSFVKSNVISPGQASVLPVAKMIKQDIENTAAAFSHDINKAIKEQFDVLKKSLPPGDKRCFDWEYIKSVLFRNFHWKNLLCKLFECLGIPIPDPFPKLTWPGWPDLWPPKFPWPPVLPLADIWELIKQAILAILCSIITMFLNLLNVDCNLYNMLTEELLVALNLDDDFARLREEIKQNPLLEFLVETVNGPLDPTTDLEMKNRIRDELNSRDQDACEEAQKDPEEPMVLETSRQALTASQDERYDPRPDVALLVKDLQIFLTPSEFCEILGGEPTIEVKDIAASVALKKFPKLFTALSSNTERLSDVLGIVGEATIGKNMCLMLANLPDMVTPPAEVCHSQSLREKLLSDRMSKEDMQQVLDRENDKRNSFIEKMLNGGGTGNAILGNLGISTPLELVGGTIDTVNNPNNPVMVPMFDDYSANFKKELIKQYFSPIKKAYNEDIAMFLDYLTDVDDAKGFEVPTSRFSYEQLHPPGDVSEKEESMLFKQMMDNPYSGLYRQYAQVKEDLGEEAAKAIRHLHFFRPSDPLNLEELDPDIKRRRMEAMFTSWHKNMAFGNGTPGATMQKKEVAKRLKALLTDSSLVDVVKEGENFFVQLRFPNLLDRRDPNDLDSALVRVDLGGKIIYDSTPGVYCSTDFRYVEDSYEISFQGPFFNSARNARKIESFKESPAKIEVKPGPVYEYFTEKMEIKNDEPFQPTAFAELLRLNTSNWSWARQKYNNDTKLSNQFKDRNSLFFESALEAYNEMEQFIFESFGRFVANSDVLNSLEDDAKFPRSARSRIDAIDVGRAGIELLAEDIVKTHKQVGDKLCPIPGLMDWDTVKDKVISQLGSLLEQQYADGPAWPSPLQYSIATAGFLNSWVRLEIVQVVLEGLVSFYEFGLDILDEKVMTLFIRSRIESRVSKQGASFKKIFEALAKKILTAPEETREKVKPSSKVEMNRFKVDFDNIQSDEPFRYVHLDSMIKSNIKAIKDKIGGAISAPENIYDSFYQTFPSLDLFKNTKILYDTNGDWGKSIMVTSEGAASESESKQDRVLYSRSGDKKGGYKPDQENQIFKPILGENGRPELREDIAPFIGEGTFAFQKYIKFVPNPGQTPESLRNIMSRPGGATDPDLAEQGFSFLDENPQFYPENIPLTDFQNFIEGLGGEPPEEQGDMTWWVEHFASVVPETPEDRYRDEDEIPYPENTYFSEFSSDSSRKKLAEMVLTKLMVNPADMRLYGQRRVPGVPKDVNSPEGYGDKSIRRDWRTGDFLAEGGTRVIKDPEGYWSYLMSGDAQWPYFEYEMLEGESSPSYKSKFMDSISRWNGPSGRSELELDGGAAFGDYISDELLARTSEGNMSRPSPKPNVPFSSSIIDQTDTSGRIFLDYWQLPEDMTEVDQYNLDYENLWIPIRFEQIHYRYKELPRFVHGSNDLFKNKAGVMKTLQEIRTTLESVKYLDGPWDALHKTWRYQELPGGQKNPLFGYGFAFAGKYTHKVILSEYMSSLITQTRDFKSYVHPGARQQPGRGVVENQTWKSCIDRALTMIANWPTMDGKEESVFESLEISPQDSLGQRGYNSRLNPYTFGGNHQGEWGIRAHGKAWEEKHTMGLAGQPTERTKYTLWWWDLACLIANEFDNPSVFTEMNPGTTTSTLSSLLSFHDDYKKFLKNKYRNQVIGVEDGVGIQLSDGYPDWQRYASDRSRVTGLPIDAFLTASWARQYYSKRDRKERDPQNEGFRSQFVYGNTFWSGDKQGFHTGDDRAFNGSFSRRVGPDIVPGLVSKRGKKSFTRPGDVACYFGLNTPGDRSRTRLEKIIREAKLLIEARDNYGFDVDPSTLDERGKSLYGYYEKFLLQRMRLPNFNKELMNYGWAQQRNLMFYQQVNMDRFWSGDYFYNKKLFGVPGQTDEGDFGFSYTKYNLPETSEDWVTFMGQVDELIEYVKSQPALPDSGTAEDDSKLIHKNSGIVKKQYAVHFVNAKSIFSGVLRRPDGSNQRGTNKISARDDSSSLDIDIKNDGAYDENGSFRVVEALMDPQNSKYWKDSVTLRERARIIRDNVKIVAKDGSEGFQWWRKMMNTWSFRGRVWWKTEYTTEVVGETSIQQVDQNSYEKSLTDQAPARKRVGLSASNSQYAGLHEVGGDDDNGKGFMLWSRGYKLAAIDEWNELQRNSKDYFYSPGVTVKSNKAFFFTWGDEDINSTSRSKRTVSKFLMKNKLAERVLGISFEEEAMWFGDSQAPEDVAESSGLNAFTTTNDRPADYWQHTKLTPLITNADFGRVFGPDEVGVNTSDDINITFKNAINAIITENSDSGSNTLQNGQGGKTLKEIINSINSSNKKKLDILLNTTAGITSKKETLELNELSIIDFWPDNCASDTNPYTWHRDYIFYNTLKKREKISRAQQEYGNYKNFISEDFSGESMGYNEVRQSLTSSGSDIVLGMITTVDPDEAPANADVIRLRAVDSYKKAPAKMISYFLPYSDLDDLYVPSPFGIHPNLALYRVSYEDDPGHQLKTARPETPIAKTQASPGTFPLSDPNVSVYTATKTLVRKRVSFAISRPESSESTTGGLGYWYYGGTSDSEGNYVELDLPPEKLDNVKAAIQYFDGRNLEGKYLSIHHASSSEDTDARGKNTQTLASLCKEIETENLLAFTYVRMWQARKNYLEEYARWAQEDVVEAFKRLTTNLQGCNLQYGSRLIYIPQMRDNGTFPEWSAALGVEEQLKPEAIGGVARFYQFFNEESSNLGLEVVSSNTDDEAAAGDVVTSNSKVFPIPYVPLVEKLAPLSIEDLVTIDKATPEEVQALGFSEAFANLVSEQDGGLPLVKFLTKGDEFVNGAFTSSLLPTNENEQSPALTVQDYLISQIKDSPESQMLFKYLFPLKRYASVFGVYSISATSCLYNLDNLFADTRERLISLLKISLDTPYDVFPSEFEKVGIMPPEMAEFYMKTRMSGFRTDQWMQLYKMIINAPKGLAMMLLSITDPFYFDAQKKLKGCDLRKGMHPRSFAMPFADNNKGHQLKPFTLYPPIPFLPPWMIGPMDVGVGGLYDSSLDSMASPLGPAFLAAGPLLGDTPKAICSYTDGDTPPSTVGFGAAGRRFRVLDPDCDD